VPANAVTSTVCGILGVIRLVAGELTFKLIRGTCIMRSVHFVIRQIRQIYFND